MSKYFSYLVKTFLLKKHTYVFLFLGVFLYLVFSFVQVFSLNSSNFSYLRNTNTFNQFFPFIIMVIYSCLFCLHFFNEPKEDGTELIFLSSTLSRFKMILTKFLVVFFFVFFFQIVNFPFYWIVAFTDQKSDIIEKLFYIFSLLIGGIVVQLFFCFLISFFSLVLSKGAVLTISIFIAALLPIFSFFLTLLGGGIPNNLKEISNPLIETKINVNSKKELETSQEKTDSKNEYFHHYDPFTTTIDEDYDQYKKSQWYGNVAFLDIWNQFNSLYSVLVVPNYYDQSSIQNWKRIFEKPKHNLQLIHELYIGKINNKKQYATLLTSKNDFLLNQLKNENISFEQNIKNRALQLDTLIKTNQTFKQEFTKENIIRRLLLVQNIIKNIENDKTEDQILQFWSDLKNDNSYNRIATIYKVEPISIWTYQYFLNEFEPNLKENIGQVTNLKDNTQAIIGNLGFFNKNNQVVNFYPSKFFPISLSIVLLLTISSLLVGTTVAIYLRKDFA